MTIDNYDLYLLDSFDSVDDIKDKQYDLFISAYNKENMVLDVYNNIIAEEKIWLIFPDYNELDKSKYEAKEYFQYDIDIDIDINYNNNESDFINSFLENYNLDKRFKETICIDITGFIKPYMIYLICALQYLNYKNIDIIYSEPKSYSNNEDTPFSINETKVVRTINWKNIRVDQGKNDLLLINIGYDHKLVDNIVNFYKQVDSHKILLGFPSLQPIMYQENILNLIKTAENLQIDHTFKPILSAANDPFDTAKIIRNELYKYIKEKEDVKIIYLAPLATKAQTLGIVVFYINEYDTFKKQGITLQIVYPFTKFYSSSSTDELSKINRYTLEF